MRLRKLLNTAISAAASAVLIVACVPAAAFAGENATLADQAETDAAIQDAIDSLDEMEAGVDYIEDEILVTYSGQDEPELISLDSGSTVEEALEEAIDDGMVVAAQPNYRYQLLDTTTTQSAGLSTSDSLSAKQYYLGSWSESYGTNVKEAWTLARTNRSVTVAVVDTGVQVTHEDLAGNIDTANMATVGTGCVVTCGPDSNMADAAGHGTHVAGIIASTANNGVGTSGTSYNATVLPINVFYEYREPGHWGVEYASDSAHVVAAYKYLDKLVESGTVTDLHVVNMSLGGYNELTSEDIAMKNAIAHLRKRHDVMTVCAGGNGFEDAGGNKVAYADTMYPADFDECVAVTALDTDGTNTEWSDVNRYKDISAPGVNILSTFTDEDGQASSAQSGTDSSYGYMGGTSVAAPMVSGIAALLWSVEPDLSVEQAVGALKSTAHAVNNSKNSRASASSATYYVNSWKTKTIQYEATGSAGAVDAAAAVRYVIDNYASSYEPPADDIVALKQVVAPARMTISSISSSKQSITFKWKMATGAAGYQIKYKAKGGSWKKVTVKDALATSATVGNLYSGKKYYFKIRAYVYDNDGSRIYGKWSAGKGIKTR